MRSPQRNPNISVTLSSGCKYSYNANFQAFGMIHDDKECILCTQTCLYRGLGLTNESSWIIWQTWRASPVWESRAHLCTLDTKKFINYLIN